MSRARSWLLADEPASPMQARMGRFYTSWLALSANPLALIGLAIVVLLLLTALLAPWIAPQDAVYAQNLDGRLQPPPLVDRSLATPEPGEHPIELQRRRDLNPDLVHDGYAQRALGDAHPRLLMVKT